jgi:hypothetical protein
MRTFGHDPRAFREPIGFVDTLALLTLASAIGVTFVAALTAIGGLLT